MKKENVLKHYLAKGNNRRIVCILVDCPVNGKYFRVKTKRLIDFKQRKISETDNIYSVETFAVMFGMFDKMLNDSEVKNKLILKELNKIKPYKGFTNIK